MNKTLSTIFLILFIALGNYSFAQAPIGGKTSWTLEECIEYAKENNLQVRQSKLGIEGARINLTQSKADLLPSLNMGAGTTYNVGRTINPFTNIIEDQSINSQNYSINSGVDIYAGGRRRNTIKRNLLELEASRFEVENVENQIILNIITAYTNVLFNQELLENTRLRLEVTELQLRRTERLYDAGAVPRANFLELKAQKANDELAVINAENDRDLTLLDLKQLLMIPFDEPFEIVIPEIEIPEINPFINERSDDIYQMAVNTQPIVNKVQYDVESALKDIEIAKGARYPTLSLNAGLVTNYSSVAPDFIPRQGAPVERIFPPIGTVSVGGETLLVESLNAQAVPTEFVENTYYNQLNTNLRRFAGLNLSIPIFNNWQVKSNIERSKISLDNAKLAEKGEMLRLRQTVEQAYLDVRAAEKRYFASKNQVEAFEESFRMSKKRFDAGDIDPVEFNVAKLNFNNAETEFIQAKYDYIFKIKLVNFYKGEVLTFENEQ